MKELVCVLVGVGPHFVIYILLSLEPLPRAQVNNPDTNQLHLLPETQASSVKDWEGFFRSIVFPGLGPIHLLELHGLIVCPTPRQLNPLDPHCSHPCLQLRIQPLQASTLAHTPHLCFFCLIYLKGMFISYSAHISDPPTYRSSSVSTYYFIPFSILLALTTVCNDLICLLHVSSHSNVSYMRLGNLSSSFTTVVLA